MAGSFPGGDNRPTAELCNFDQNVGETTPVGSCSPQGDSPYGCADMAGNVLEWTQSLFDGYPYNPQDGRESLGGGRSRAFRGGALESVVHNVRCAFRNGCIADPRAMTIGFRVVSTPLSPRLSDPGDFDRWIRVRRAVDD